MTTPTPLTKRSVAVPTAASSPEEGAQLFEDYYAYQRQYQAKYGERTLILLENGHFMEVYGVDNEQERIGFVYEVADILRMNYGKKNNSNPDNSRRNHLLVGFPKIAMNKHIPLLIQAGFTIVLVEQTTPPPSPTRAVTRILSPSTYIDDANSYTKGAPTLMSLFFQFSKTGGDLLSIAMCCMDLTIGRNIVYYCQNLNRRDLEVCRDECYRFIHSYRPVEILLYCEHEEDRTALQSLVSYLNISETRHMISVIPLEYTNPAYQNELLRKVFPEHGMMSPVCYLGLERYDTLVANYCALIQFTFEHNEGILSHLPLPVFWRESKYLILENNAIYQLNLVPTQNVSHTLFDIVNYTHTAIGRRLLRDRILAPIIDVVELEKRYTQIQLFHGVSKRSEAPNRIYEAYEPLLRRIYDIERIHRRIENGSVQPNDFVLLEKSYENIEAAMIQFRDDLSGFEEKERVHFDSYTEAMFQGFQSWRAAYRSVFQLDRCVPLDSITGSFFQPGVDREIDELEERIQREMAVLNEIANELSRAIESHVTVFPSSSRGRGSRSGASKAKSTTSPEDPDEESTSSTLFVRLDSTDRDGYFYTMTNKRAEMLRQYGQSVFQSRGWDPECAHFVKQTSSTKLFLQPVTKISKAIDTLREKLIKRCVDLFALRVKELYADHRGIFPAIVGFVGELDWICSNAHCALTNNYCRPEILGNFEENHSCVLAKSMRHPMIEQIQKAVHYVPNDVALGLGDNKGLLLFGTNSSGKSSYMKAVGLNVIMAQSGMFVPSSRFQYVPYKNLLTRISGEDNIVRGHSSFVTEMVELRTILNRTNENSLVLGDEICHGTEQASGLAIVASSILTLSRNECSFIFATHLHALTEIPEITSLVNVKMAHLRVTYDEARDVLVYDRKITPGSGLANYGIEIAKYIIQEQPEFIQQCMTFRKRILGISERVLESKPSRYNAAVIMDRCQVCNRPGEDVHHIHEQCSADEAGRIQRGETQHHKNVAANLVVLCKRCHINVHHWIDGERIRIEGYRATTGGRQLEYRIEKSC